MTTPDPPLTDSSILRRRAVLWCIATTVVVAGVEIAVGLWFGLLSITAEGLHSAADLADSLVALALVRIAAQPADREHPYGHGKYDSLAALIEGAMVGLSGAWAIYKGMAVMLGQAAAEPRPEAAAIVAMVLAAVVYLLVSRRVLRIARQTGSPAVLAEAMHLRTHIYIVLGLLGGLITTRVAQAAGWAYADRMDAGTAVLLGVVLLVIAGFIIRPALTQLLDTALPAEDLTAIRACFEEFRREFVEIHAIRTRRAGTERHVDIHLMVRADMTVGDAHDLAHRIEARLAERIAGSRLLVHIEPADTKTRGKLGEVRPIEHSPGEAEDSHHAHDAPHG